jgi:uncharacterized protein (TIGR02246 family)
MAKKYGSDEAAIRKLDAEWSKAASEGKLARVMTFYAKDGSVVWPDQPFAKGHKAIRASWDAEFKDDAKLHLDFEPTHIEISGDMASDFGLVHFAPGAKARDVKNTAKYLVVWKREKGTWKVLYDSWNWNAKPKDRK